MDFQVKRSSTGRDLFRMAHGGHVREHSFYCQDVRLGPRNSYSDLGIDSVDRDCRGAG